MKSLAYTFACGLVRSCCPAYCETLGIIDGVVSVPGFACGDAGFGGR
jgi:hypothetical protein